MQNKITITKGKLLKNETVVEVEFLKSDGTDSKPAECSEKNLKPPHDDLKEAFARLAVHAAVIGEFLDLDPNVDLADPELASGFSVSGFSLSDEGQAVILTGRKILKSGKTMGFNTPLIKISAGDSDKDPEYQFSDDLNDCLDECKNELAKYLNGKVAPDLQGNLFHEAELVTG